MAICINGNNDGNNGQNESYTIRGRGTVSRSKLVREVKQGKHPVHSTYKINGKEYVRANPDNSTGNNINK